MDRQTVTKANESLKFIEGKLTNLAVLQVKSLDEIKEEILKIRKIIEASGDSDQHPCSTVISTDNRSSRDQSSDKSETNYRQLLEIIIEEMRLNENKSESLNEFVKKNNIPESKKFCKHNNLNVSLSKVKKDEIPNKIVEAILSARKL